MCGIVGLSYPESVYSILSVWHCRTVLPRVSILCGIVGLSYPELVYCVCGIVGLSYPELVYCVAL